MAAVMKRSYLEKSVNIKLIVLLLLQTIVCIVCAIGHNRWHLIGQDSDTPWYLEVGRNEHEFIYLTAHPLPPVLLTF